MLKLPFSQSLGPITLGPQSYGTGTHSSGIDYTGLDFDLSEADAVLAMADGTIVSVYNLAPDFDGPTVYEDSDGQLQYYDGAMASVGNAGYGNMITVEHQVILETGETLTFYATYAHLSQDSMTNPDTGQLYQFGDPVEQGDFLGEIGWTGITTGDHLHVQIAVGTNIDDPVYAIANGDDAGAIGDLNDALASQLFFEDVNGPNSYSGILANKKYISGNDDADGDGPPLFVDVPLVQGPQRFAANSGFETGDLNGWEVLGSATAVTSFDADGSAGPVGDGLTTATEGDYFAVLESGGNASANQIEVFLGLEFDALETISDGVPTTGTAIKIEVDVIRSTAFDFDFYFDAGDYDPYNDFAFMVIDGELVAFGDLKDVGDYGDSGWLDSSWFDAGTTDLSRGTHEIGFGILDVGDEFLSSALYVDDFLFV